MMPGMPDLGQILLQAQQMQAEMERAQASLAETEVTGSAAGGLVTVVVNGGGELLRVKIDPSVVDPAEVETLEDLVIAAVHDARRAAEGMASTAMSSVAGSLDLSAMGLPGLGFPGFGDQQAVGPGYDDEEDDDDDEDVLDFELDDEGSDADDDDDDDDAAEEELVIIEAIDDVGRSVRSADEPPSGPAAPTGGV